MEFFVTLMWKVEISKRNEFDSNLFTGKAPCKLIDSTKLLIRTPRLVLMVQFTGNNSKMKEERRQERFVILGLNISHDASAALTTNQGRVIAAIAEERISRKKNHQGIPRKAIELILNLEVNESIDRIVIGSNKELPLIDAYQMLASLEGNPSTPEGYGRDIFPGYLHKFQNDTRSAQLLIEESILAHAPLSINETKVFEWIKHHDSHLGCALGAAKNKQTLLFSLDAIGDGESGAISH
jgi:carbamoyltransferase